MEIFISWSGERSKAVAEILREWLPNVIQNLKPCISSADVEKGSRWLIDISENLESCNFGLLCLTPENMDQPWILFEAGAIAKSIDSSFVCPILFDCSPTDLKGPLAHFQATVLEKKDMLKLIQAINSNLKESALPDIQLNTTFELWWPILDDQLKEISEFEGNIHIKRSERDLLEEVLKNCKVY